METVESPAKYTVTGSLGEFVEPPAPVALLLAPPAPASIVTVVPSAPPVPMLESALEPLVDAATAAVLLALVPLALEVANVLLEAVGVPLWLATALLAVTDPVACMLLAAPVTLAGDFESLAVGSAQATTSPIRT